MSALRPKADMRELHRDRLHKKSIFCTKSSPLVELYVQSRSTRRIGDDDSDANVGRPLRPGERAKNRQAQKRNPADASKFHGWRHSGVKGLKSGARCSAGF